MKKYILTTMVLVAALAFAEDGKEKTIQERVEIAALDTTKIAELMPEKTEDRDKFRTELLSALDKMPASPRERGRKIVAAKKAFSDFQEKERGSKVILCPVAAPKTFTGAMALDLTSTNSVASTNIIWALEEIDMGYGLDRKPRTMDKSKKYYPGWRRGENPEPGGYPCQTIH